MPALKKKQEKFSKKKSAKEKQKLNDPKLHKLSVES